MRSDLGYRARESLAQPCTESEQRRATHDCSIQGAGREERGGRLHGPRLVRRYLHSTSRKLQDRETTNTHRIVKIERDDTRNHRKIRVGGRGRQTCCGGLSACGRQAIPLHKYYMERIQTKHFEVEHEARGSGAQSQLARFQPETKDAWGALPLTGTTSTSILQAAAR